MNKAAFNTMLSGNSFIRYLGLLLSQLLNRSADYLKQHIPAELAGERLFLALNPAIQPGFRLEIPGRAAQFYYASALARSHQQLVLVDVPAKDVSLWLEETTGTAPRQLPLDQTFKGLIPQSIKADATPASSTKAPSSNVKAARWLPLMRNDLLAEAPFKLLVTGMALVNANMVVNELIKDPSWDSGIKALGGVSVLGTAGASLLEKASHLEWEKIASQTGKNSALAQSALGRTFQLGVASSIGLVLASGVDVYIHGGYALEAFKTGDYNNAIINTGLVGVSGFNVGVGVALFRAYRAGKAAALAGQTATAGRMMLRTRQLHLIALGLAVSYVGGLVAHIYTQDTPLEKWVRRTHLGQKPADWSRDYSSTLVQLYKALFPVELQLARENEINPRTGERHNATYLTLHLVGQERLEPEAIQFAGVEQWGGFFGWRAQEEPVNFTGADFQPHEGTRIHNTAGAAVYRRVYHRQADRRLKGLEGTLIYTPAPGITLPEIEVNL